MLLKKRLYADRGENILEYKIEWLVDGRYTVADIGVYGYVSMAGQGGYDMARFPAIAAWIARFESQPGWVPLV